MTFFKKKGTRDPKTIILMVWVHSTNPPETICFSKEVRQFLGLCNFFRGHVRNFAQLTSSLTALTKKDCSWKGGQLPPDALTAFLELQSYLCSEPIVDYPRNNRPYALIVDASLGDDKKPGGLGAILTQVRLLKAQRLIPSLIILPQLFHLRQTPIVLL